MNDLQQLSQDAVKKLFVKSQGALEYEASRGKIITLSSKALVADETLPFLIGQCPVQTVIEKIRWHTQLMGAVIRFQQYELLCGFVAWSYRVYQAHGFNYEYFIVEHKMWKTVIKQAMGENGLAIEKVYEWLLANHEKFIILAKSQYAFFPPEQMDVVTEKFVNMLVSGDQDGCISMIQRTGNISEFYAQVIQPALYQIGQYWELAELSIAQEHLATNIVYRCMTTAYLTKRCPVTTKGSAVVTASVNEFHEVGARMVADELEMGGWRVHYLGANTPAPDLLRFLHDTQPFLLAMSITMPFNIRHGDVIIREIRASPVLRKIRIILGGQAFTYAKDLWRHLEANGYARNAQEVVRLANDWWADRGEVECGYP